MTAFIRIDKGFYKIVESIFLKIIYNEVKMIIEHRFLTNVFFSGIKQIN